MYSRVYILQLNFGLRNSQYRWLWDRDRLLVTGKNMVVYSENSGIESNIHNITWKSIFTPIARAILDLGAVREGPYVIGKPRATGRATKFPTK